MKNKYRVSRMGVKSPRIFYDCLEEALASAYWLAAQWLSPVEVFNTVTGERERIINPTIDII